MNRIAARLNLLGALALAALLAPPLLQAQAPSGSTGQCRDGSYTTAAKKWQACSGHKGVQAWYAESKSAAASSSVAAPVAPAAAGSKPAAATARTAAAAPGGGPGLVWLNPATNVYHCPGGAFYGKTKDGKYVPEADAKKAGARPDHNRPCQT